MEIAIIQKRIAPFRIPFFERLGAYPDVDLTIFHGGGSCDHYRYFKTKQYMVLKIKLGFIRIFISLGLLYTLISKKYRVIIFEGAISNLSFLMYLPLLKMLGRRVCWWSSGWEPSYAKKGFRALRNFVYKLISKMSDRIIVYSTMAKKYYESLGNQPSKIVMALNSLDNNIYINAEKDISVYRINKLRKKYGLTGKKVILYVGKIEENKKLGLLLSAYKRLNAKELIDKITLVIIGDGSITKTYEEYVIRNNLANVHFLGEIRDPFKLAPFFMTAFLCVVPGSGGLVVYHSMLHGVPVLVSEADGTEHDLVLSERTGFYFKKDDLDHLTNMIFFVLSMGKNQYQTIRRAARNHIINNFPLNEMVQQFYKAIY